jgi:hypothetical protein
MRYWAHYFPPQPEAHQVIPYSLTLGVSAVRILVKNNYVYLVFALIAGCTNISPIQDNAIVAIDEKACIGTIMTPPAGLAETDDTELLQAAQGESGQGRLCAGKVFVAEKPVTVYRVWDSTHSYTAYGSWWSLSDPQGPRDNYRKEEDICPEWSALDRMSACSLKVGAKVVIGPGQSVNCNNNLSYPPSSVNQVYIPNDSRNNKVYVENCSAGADWPSPQPIASKN